MTDWIAVDWGTTNMRAWAMSAAGNPIAEAVSDKGMASLAPEEFEPALLALVGDWIDAGPVDVLACGMVGARQGWAEAAYIPVPAAPQGARPTRAPARDARLRVHILPGMSQAAPPDVMRGEETQIAGFMATHPGWDGILCLPGTHCKWAEISAGEVVSFRTFMTGELFALLSRHSVLRHSLNGSDWQDDAFLGAVSDTMSRPERLAGDLFGIRAAGLLQGLAPGAAQARLSGLLIGAELAAARPYWLGRQVAIIGASALASRYDEALRAQGVPTRLEDATGMTLAGLRAAHAALTGAA